jgi:hypothetical protein
MTLPIYTTGTVSVTHLGTTVTGAGGMWSGINAREGDFFVRADGVAVITEVTDQATLQITPWPGATVTGGTYAIQQNYVGRVVGVAAAEDVGVMLEKLHTDGLPFIVGADETVPDPSYGDEGQLAFQPTTGHWWVKSGGVWVPSAGIGSSTPSSTNPIMDGAAAPGSAGPYSREDHIHPSDTSRAPTVSPTFTGVPVFNLTSGYGFKMTGDGTVTPSKYLRVNAGDFQITNNANVQIFDLTDAGKLRTGSLALDVNDGSAAQPFHASSSNVSATGVTSNSSEISVPSYNMNTIINAQDNIGLNPASCNQLNTLAVINTVGGSQVNGARNSFFSQVAVNTATSPTNPYKDYVAAQFFAEAFVNDGGTDVTIAASKGNLFATNPVALLQGNATNWAEITGGEVNVAVQAGCSVSYKSAWTLVAMGTDAVQGSVYDGALSISGQAGNIGWRHGILFSQANSGPPMHPAGTLIGTQDAGTVANGVDISSYTITGSAFRSPGFAVNGAGAVTAAGGGAGSGTGLNVGGTMAAFGYFGRAGTTGAWGGNFYNFIWGSGMAVWVDATSVGVMTLTSDYRIKKDVIDLPGMWETVKALQPIKYTQAEFSPPSHLAHIEQMQAEGKEVSDAPLFAADEIERWGFIAHELQETLIQSAATGTKDAPDTIQSPNPWTVIAALTKALQEAMARIEALEAASQ